MIRDKTSLSESFPSDIKKHRKVLFSNMLITETNLVSPDNLLLIKKKNLQHILNVEKPSAS